MSPSLQSDQPERDVVIPDVFIARAKARLGASEVQLECSIYRVSLVGSASLELCKRRLDFPTVMALVARPLAP